MTNTKIDDWEVKSPAEARNKILYVCAVELTEAKYQLAVVEEDYPEDMHLIQLKRNAVSDAQEDYDFAYERYTNPFDARKTVDARWPRVGADPYTMRHVLNHVN